MIWLLAGLATLGLLVVSARYFANASPRAVAKGVSWAAVVLVVVVLLLIGWRTGWFLIPLGLLASLAMWHRQRPRGFNTAAGQSSPGQSSPGQTSRVHTRTLRMELDHDTGAMTGTILAGPWRGRDLAELTLSELLVLWRDCRADDPESVPLLEAWADRAFPEWRQDEGREQAATPPPPGGRMSRAEALSVLGLHDGASEAEIRAAYLRLMRTAHPDRGGSDWLAARVNEARDVLLG